MLELLPRDFSQVALTARQLNFQCRRGLRGKLSLSFDDRLADGGHSFATSRYVHAHVAADVVECDRDQEIVDVVAAQMGIAIGCDDLEDSIMQLEDRDVESAATQVVHGDDIVLFLVESVSQGSRRRLIH